MMPFIAKELGRESSQKEGWLTGTMNRIQQEENSNITLGVCFPVASMQEEVTGMIDQIAYYGFYENINEPEKYEEGLEERLSTIVERFQPDVIHMFGTEYAHGYAMVKAVKEKKKIAVSIQGLCAIYAEVYYANLPTKVQKRITFRDVVKKDTLIVQQRKFYKRGKREQEILREVTHVLGRTQADYEYSKGVNPASQYHNLCETVREEFYKNTWKLEECERYTILVTQADYPLKGFHLLVEALVELKKEFPHVQVHVTGNCITNYRTLRDKIKIGAYGNYIRQLVASHQLESNITYEGMVDASRMCQLMKQSHVLVNCSSMENSPNSVGEAMLLGLPVVASRVGGVPSMIEDEVEGLLYEAYDTKKLADQIGRIFGNDELATSLSRSARERAHKTHDPENNYKTLVSIYEEIAKG